MKDKVFIDTNLFIYALTESQDEKDCRKRETVVSLFENIIQNQLMVIFSQVINEFHFNLFREFSLSDCEVMEIINENIVPIAQITPVSFHTCVQAYSLRNNYSLSFWDSMIVSSALENGCSALYSEDMKHGLLIENNLTIASPFV